MAKQITPPGFLSRVGLSLSITETCCVGGASYTVPLEVNGREYAVKLQPERHNKIAVLQALQIERQDDFPDFMMITDNCLLSSFLEILLVQGLTK